METLVHFVDTNNSDYEGVGRALGKWLNERRWLIIGVAGEAVHELWRRIPKWCCGVVQPTDLGRRFHIAGTTVAHAELMELVRVMYVVLPNHRTIRKRIEKNCHVKIGDKDCLSVANEPYNYFVINALDIMSKPYRVKDSLN